MNSIDTAFAKLKAAKRTAFVPFLAAGDPDLAFTQDAVQGLATAGATLVELGVPFSDPVADGPVIQAAYTRALANGFRVDDFFAMTKDVRTVPMVAMASYSLIHKRGPAKFVADALAANISGAVVPDLPVEEADTLAKIAAEREFKLILLVTPTTSPRRAEQIVRVCTGFVYVVSLVGITGVQAAVPGDLAAMLTRLRGLTDKPLCVGFGVSTPEQAGAMAELADGVIVGSALVKTLVSGNADRSGALHAMTTLATSIARAINAVRK